MPHTIPEARTTIMGSVFKRENPTQPWCGTWLTSDYCWELISGPVSKKFEKDFIPIQLPLFHQREWGGRQCCLMLFLISDVLGWPPFMVSTFISQTSFWEKLLGLWNSLSEKSVFVYLGTLALWNSSYSQCDLWWMPVSVYLGSWAMLYQFGIWRGEAWVAKVSLCLHN